MKIIDLVIWDKQVMKGGHMTTFPYPGLWVYEKTNINCRASTTSKINIMYEEISPKVMNHKPHGKVK